MKPGLLLLLMAYCLMPLRASDSSSLFQKRQCMVQTAVFGGTGVVYTGLYSLWYSSYPMQQFQWINDSREWRGIDKFGHAFSAFQLSNQTYQWFRWSGYSRRKSAGFSAISALYFQNPLEILDGFSSGWGASKADLAANATGALLSAAQLYSWGETKVLLRLSYSPTPYAPMRPGTLGSNAVERLMKDYNGQTYWLSVGLADALGCKSKIPAWLNLAVGYGADGMLGGYSNQWLDKNGQQINRSDIQRSSQWYLAPDIRLSRIPVKKIWLRQLFGVLDVVKFPTPVLMLQSGKLRIKPLFF